MTMNIKRASSYRTNYGNVPWVEMVKVSIGLTELICGHFTPDRWITGWKCRPIYFLTREITPRPVLRRLQRRSWIFK